ncbi:hypothetical protein [Ottowia thiooxydans]|uniref:hypothetical protein n=1 Tax=Ottowia thiooxydans TaxID=219182 RepID=UPI000490C87E|nr:hypothetical protein [Ottowia thiooxydans]
MSAPTWQQLRDTRWMVMDVSTLQLAVYPTETCTVALMSQAPGVEQPQILWVSPEDVPLLVERLQQAQRLAEEGRESRMQAESVQAAFDLIERMRRRD